MRASLEALALVAWHDERRDVFTARRSDGDVCRVAAMIVTPPSDQLFS